MTKISFACVAVVVLSLGCGARVEPDPSSAPLSSGEGIPNDEAGDHDAGDWNMTDDVGYMCDTPSPLPYDTGSTSLDTASDSSLAASEDSAPAAAPPSIDCMVDDFGPSSGTLVSFDYQIEVASCPSSDCSDFVWLDPGCAMTLQVKGAKSTATLSADDCARFTRWVTSDLLVSKLRDTVTCYGKDVAGKFESTRVQRSDGWAAKKTATCDVEPFVSHRACIAKLRAKYFPGK